MIRFLASPHTRFIALLGLTAACFFWGTLLVAQTDEANADAKDESKVAAGVTKEPLAFIAEGGIPTTIEQLRMMEELVAEVAAEAKPATVNIEMARAQGSGVVVTSDGYILTAAHVIGNRANRLAKITFPDGKKVNAVTMGVNDRYDSGMLKIIDDGPWPYLDIGESDPLNRGQWVLALGHPGGLKKDRGIVVRIGRLLSKVTGTLRTDCTLVGGDSGGPLIDMNGYVIGIHSRIGGELTENMHVAIDVFSDEWDDLEAAGMLPRLGLNFKNNTNEIRTLSKGEAAEKAGLKKGDVIFEAASQPITNGDDLGKVLKDFKADDTITVVVVRDDEEKEFEIKLGYRHKKDRRILALEGADDEEEEEQKEDEEEDEEKTDDKEDEDDEDEDEDNKEEKDEKENDDEDDKDDK